MGFFANLYLIEIFTLQDSAIVETTIYGGHIEPKAYFSWGPAERPGGLQSYAHETLFSDTKLERLPGYPMREQYPAKEPFLLDASFNPRELNDPVVFHLVLHERYVPMRNNTPFIQPTDPSVYKASEKIIITYPVIGSSNIRFWVTAMREGESLDDYDMSRIMIPEKVGPDKTIFGFNGGIFKIVREVFDRS